MFLSERERESRLPPECSYHNASPCDARGHFLLVPTLDDAANWRSQRLLQTDCLALAALAQSTSLALTYNSVRAGASQNHVHCHAWPPPPVAALRGGYAAARASARESRRLLLPPPEREEAAAEDDALASRVVHVALLDYPVCCVRVRGADARATGDALAHIVQAFETRGVPHNLALLGDEAFCFARRADGERAAEIFPDFKLGASEMLGVFHCASQRDLDAAAHPGTMASALKAVSANADEIWLLVLNALGDNAGAPE